MKRVSQDPWELVGAGQYERAIEKYTQLYAIEESARWLWGRGRALLLAGDPTSALNDFQLAVSDRGARDLATIDFIYPGICYWYLDKPAQAVDCWRQALDAPYSDAAGGVTPPALLVYAGRRLHDKKLSGQGIQLLRRHWRNWQARQKRREKRVNPNPTHSDFVYAGLAVWPGMIVPFLLEMAGIVDLRRSVSDAKHPTLRKRWKCQAEFYIAVRALAIEDFVGFREAMTRCAAIDEGRMEFEYYLARWELLRCFPESAFRSA